MTYKTFNIQDFETNNDVMNSYETGFGDWEINRLNTQDLYSTPEDCASAYAYATASDLKLI
jgi:hypothetical protein